VAQRLLKGSRTYRWIWCSANSATCSMWSLSRGHWWKKT